MDIYDILRPYMSFNTIWEMIEKLKLDGYEIRIEKIENED